MDINDVKKIIANGESITVEYKQSIAGLEDLGKTISALLNTKGGHAFLGITNQGDITGIEVNDSTKKKLTTFLAHFDPHAEINIHYIPLKKSNKQIVVFVCEYLKNRIPYTYKGRPYIKTESGKKLMSAERYKQLLMENAGVSKAWESMIANHFSIDDLDLIEIIKTLKIGIKEGRIPEEEYSEEPEKILTHFDLLQDNKLNNAAMVLFAKKMPAEYSRCFIRMGRFVDETMDEVIDSKQIRGNAFQLLSEAESFVRRNIPISSHYDPNRFERIDEAALPLLAIREAIINAICHRDYSHRAGDIALLIFNDHLQIHNPGHLYGGITIDQLDKMHPSRRRNEKISQVFYARGLIDRWGGGTRRIFNLCAKQDLPKPEFSEASDGLLVKFYFKAPINPTLSKKSQEIEYKLTERRTEILQILAAKRSCSLQDILNTLKNPPASRTVRDDLAYLKQAKLVNSDGHGRGAKWFLVEKEINNKAENKAEKRQ